MDMLGIGIGYIFFGIVIWGISLLVLYFIIKAAVRNGNIEAQERMSSSGTNTNSSTSNCPLCGYSPITSVDKKCPRCKSNL